MCSKDWGLRGVEEERLSIETDMLNHMQVLIKSKFCARNWV